MVERVPLAIECGILLLSFFFLHLKYQQLLKLTPEIYYNMEYPMSLSLSLSFSPCMCNNSNNNNHKNSNIDTNNIF
jgi:hypothetical protein